jgi:hypothetical protein
MTAAAQPGTGLVVDGQGAIYFADTGQGPWKIDANGNVVAQDGPPSDYMAADPEGRFAGVRLPASSSADMKHAGSKPMLIFSSRLPARTGRFDRSTASLRDPTIRFTTPKTRPSAA